MVTRSASMTSALEYAAAPPRGHSCVVGALIQRSKYSTNSSPSGMPLRVEFQAGSRSSKQGLPSLFTQHSVFCGFSQKKKSSSQLAAETAIYDVSGLFRS